jgi:GNAT superfamily N-acetyltransferase
MFRTVTEPAELRRAAELLGYTFDPVEINHWMVPDPAERQSRMTDWFQILAEHAASGAGRVVVNGDFTAVAVWFDRTGEGAEPENYEERLVAAAGPHLARFTEVDELLEKNHPAEPHWHLGFLVVEPGKQGQGLGAALLGHTLETTADPVYLEATSEDSRRFYATRFGFTALTPAEIAPVGGPAFHRMIWHPAA